MCIYTILIKQLDWYGLMYFLKCTNCGCVYFEWTMSKHKKKINNLILVGWERHEGEQIIIQYLGELTMKCKYANTTCPVHTLTLGYELCANAMLKCNNLALLEANQMQMSSARVTGHLVRAVRVNLTYSISSDALPTGARGYGL